MTEVLNAIYEADFLGFSYGFRPRRQAHVALDALAVGIRLRFTSLAHLLTPEFLTETWGMMNRRAASGIDGESTEQFENELKQRVEESCAQRKLAGELTTNLLFAAMRRDGRTRAAC